MEPVHYPRCNDACDEHHHVLRADDTFEVPGRWPITAWAAASAVMAVVIVMTVVGLVQAVLSRG